MKKQMEEEVLLYFLANDNNTCEGYDSSSFCSSYDNEDIDDLYNELCDSLIRAKKELKLANNKIEVLNEEIKMIRIENDMLSIMTKK